MNLETRWTSIHEDCELYVERAARLILQKRDDLDEFIMGMGTALFTVKGQTGYDRHRSVSEVDKYLHSFIIRWDDRINITGTPMRFTKYGEKRTQW